MLFSIKEWIENHRKTSLWMGLIASLCVLLICLHVGNSYDKESNETTYVKQFTKDEVTEDDFPYHYLNHYDLEEDGEETTLIDLNECTEDQFSILEAGIYKISGTLNGCLYLKAKDETIHLIFDSVEIESYDGPALIIEDATRVIITLAENSSNKISDSGRYKDNNEYESCIQSNADLTFNGTGYLEVYGLYKDGIRSRDTVKFVDSNVSIYSKRTAIHGTDGIYVSGGELFISSEKNGFKTTKNGLNYRGALLILGGEITVIAGEYSFVTDAPAYIFNCLIHENSTARFGGNGVKSIDEGCFQ